MCWSAMTCDRNPQLLKEKWVSILRHTVDKHDWDSSVLYNCCAHEPISPRAHRKTKWLIVGSPAHEALKHVVLKKTLLKDLDLLTKTIHTGALEVYHSLYNKYAPKRQHFGYLGMVARTQLTALDHNSGTGRSQAEASSGEKRLFSKRRPSRTSRKCYTQCWRWETQEKSQSKFKSLISQKSSHPFHAFLKRTFSHGMYPGLEKN